MKEIITVKLVSFILPSTYPYNQRLQCGALSLDPEGIRDPGPIGLQSLSNFLRIFSFFSNHYAVITTLDPYFSKLNYIIFAARRQSLDSTERLVFATQSKLNLSVCLSLSAQMKIIRFLCFLSKGEFFLRLPRVKA